MQIDFDDFFKYTQRNYLLTEEDYLQVEPYINSAKAFARITGESVYMVDYYKQGFIYVSPNPLFLCGEEPEQVLNDGYNFYFRHIPKSEIPLLLEINKAGFEFYENIPVEDRLNCFISYDIPLIQKNNRIQIVNHKLTPLLLDKYSTLWLAIAFVSRSSAKKPGNIYMSKYESNEIFHYDLVDKEWHLQTLPELNIQEKEILRLAAQGFTNIQIAEKMYLSVSTIKFHKNNLFKKFGVKNISQAIVFSSNHKLL